MSCSFLRGTTSGIFLCLQVFTLPAGAQVTGAYVISDLPGSLDLFTVPSPISFKAEFSSTGIFNGSIVFQDANTQCSTEDICFGDGGTGPFGEIFINGELAVDREFPAYGLVKNEWGVSIGTTRGMNDITDNDFVLGFRISDNILTGDIITFQPFSYVITPTPIWEPTVAAPFPVILVDAQGRNLNTSVPGGTVGDFDDDNDVDGADFLLWQRGKSPDLTDLAAWQGNYGIGSGALQAITSVPEPTSLMLLLIGLFFINQGKKWG